MEGTADATEGVAVDAATLLGDDSERFEAVLSGEASGPVAVVGDPFAHRGVVLDRAVEALDATRVALEPGDGVDDVRAAFDAAAAGADAGAVVVEHCQQLYERRVGGFAPLSAFLDELATVDATVVTGWNRYAWAYLAAVRALDREFPVTVALEPLPAERLAELVLDRYDGMPAFAADDPDRGGLVVTRRVAVGWGNRSVTVPVPVPSPVAVRELFADGDVNPKDVTFGRLAAVSNGNVGVAASIWDRRRSAEVRPSDVDAPVSDLDVDREEAFCLRVVLAKERVARDQLAAIVDDVDRVLARLCRDGVVAVEDGVVELVPEAVPAAATATDRGRIL